MSDPSTTVPTKPHSVCNTCGIDLLTPADAAEHRASTLAASDDHRSHSTSVVNPTVEESEAWRVRRIVERAIESATERACESIDDHIQEGSLTDAQAAAALRDYPDFADAWSSYIEEDGR